MADAQSTFAINLEDGTSGPAADAAGALTTLREAIDADTKSLAAMQKAMKAMQGATVKNDDQIQKLKVAIDGKKQAVAQATAAYLKMGGSLDRIPPKGGKVTSMLEQLTKNAQGLGGPMGGVIGRLTSLKGLLAGGVIAFGIMAIVGALAALTVGTAAAVLALAAYGVAQADARRSELLRLEGLTKMRNIYGIAAGKAGDLQDAIDSVAASSALGRDQIAKYAEQLYRAHMRGNNLKLALEGVAIKASTQGEAAAQMWASWAQGAAMTGRSVKKLADDVKARLGGIAARQLLSLDVQTRKLKENFSALFSGLRIESLLGAFNTITSLFAQSTATGKALKFIVETLFQPLLGGAESATPIVKRFFQGIVIAALRVVIAVLLVRNWFKRTFGDSTLFKGLDLATVALYAGMAAGAAFIGVLGVLTVMAASLAGAFVLAGLAIWKYAQYVKGVMTWVWSTLGKWTDFGMAIAEGIADGVKRGAKWVWEAIKGLGSGAMKLFKSALGIASPSKAFARLGLAIPQGLQVGVERGRPGAQRVVSRLVDVPRAPRIAPGDVEPASGEPTVKRPAAQASTVTVTVGDIHVHGVNAREQGEDLKRQLERIFEGVAVQMGARLPGGA